MCVNLQDVHQTRQPGENDGGLRHRAHQRDLPERRKRLVSHQRLRRQESVPGSFPQRSALLAQLPLRVFTN